MNLYILLSLTVVCFAALFIAPSESLNQQANLGLIIRPSALKSKAFDDSANNDIQESPNRRRNN